MTSLSTDLGHDPRPLTATGLARLLVAAVTVVAVQVSIIDPIETPILRQLDLPLALAAALVLANPAQSSTIGLVFGLVVDASGQRLFGLHCVAYTVLGPIARGLPVPAWRRRRALIAWRAGAQGLGAATVVAIGQGVAAGAPVPGAPLRVLQIAVLTGLLAVPASRLTAVDAVLGDRGPAAGHLRRPSGGATRSALARTLGR